MYQTLQEVNLDVIHWVRRRACDHALVTIARVPADVIHNLICTAIKGSHDNKQPRDYDRIYTKLYFETLRISL